MGCFILESSFPPPFRFNCGTGIAIIISETKIKLGAWHTVTLYRDGLNGLLQLNNGTPVTGQSQVSVSPYPHLVLKRRLLQRARLWTALGG